ncbi:MAG TPA: GAP family protein [Candidatus Saccharimonadales bacterium]
MIGLLFSLAFLGLASIDALGIAAMPVLLTQHRPFARSFTFLGGSFAALMLVGLVLARGFGTIVLRFEADHSWLVPAAEIAAGLVLLVVAATLFWQLKTGRTSVEPSRSIVKRLQLGNIQLFILGGIIVTVQSIADVVFVIAMIRVGQLDLSAVGMVVAVTTYAVAALVLQLAVVAAYRLAPEKQRLKTLDKVHALLAAYSHQALICISSALGCALLIGGLLGFGR